METQLERIAKIAKSKPEERFTSLIHLIKKEALIQCHNDMNCSFAKFSAKSCTINCKKVNSKLLH